MNESFILSCCSTVDLPADLLEQRGIRYTCFHYFLDGVEYPDDLGKSMPLPAFYQAMVDGADTRTAQVNVEEYRTYFTELLQQGKDVLHVTLSSGISGSYNSACIAAELLREQFPEQKLLVVDSLGASSGSGLIMMTLADMRDEGKSIQEIYDWIMHNRLRMHHWFCSTDLTFYVKGGRVTKAAGWFGTVLRICPVLNMDYLGRLIPRFKVRGKQNALRELEHQMEEHAENGTDYNGHCCMSHSNCRADAEFVAALVKKHFPHLQGDVQIYDIGTTIGSHSGPGTVALYFWGDERKN